MRPRRPAPKGNALRRRCQRARARRLGWPVELVERCDLAVAAYREAEQRYWGSPGSEWADLFDGDDLTNRTDVYRRTVEYVDIEISRMLGGK